MNNKIRQAVTRYRPDFSYYDKDAVIGRSIKLYGEYSQLEVDFLCSFLNSNCIVYDIGGNIGYHARAFASIVNHVYTFEPNPDNYALLKKNIDDVKNVTALPCAVGHQLDVCNVRRFDLSKAENYGSSSVSFDGQGTKTMLLPIDLMGLPGPDFIKIDVEGTELAVILGAKKNH